MATFWLLLCVTTWSLNLVTGADVPLHGPSPLGNSPSGRSVKPTTTAMPMKMMIDMRGFPDIEGNCFRGAGFYRNQTDCTQFYRCVDYFNKKRYTFYRFMCGPMTVFDESRSLCTGPDIAVPKCNETIPVTSEQPPSTYTFTETPTPTTPYPYENCGSGSLRTCIDSTTTTTTKETTTSTTTTETTNIDTATPTAETTPDITTTPFEDITPTPSPPKNSTPTTPFQISTTTEDGMETTAPNNNETSTESSSTSTTSATTPADGPVDPVTDITPTPTQTTTTTTTTENPGHSEDHQLITVIDHGGDVIVPPSEVTIPKEQPFGLVYAKNTTIIIDGVSVTIPPSSVMVFETPQDGGGVTNVINGFTSNSSQASLPPGTKITIYTLNSQGLTVSSQTIIVTQSTSTVTLPSNTPVGTLQVSQDKLISIGKWVYSYVYVTYLTKVTYYQVVSSVTTTTVTVQTTSTSISTNSQYISGIVTVGGSANTDGATSELVVQPNQVLGILPPGGKGVVTINGDIGSSTEFNVDPGTLLTITIPMGSTGQVTDLYQQMFTSSSSKIVVPVGSIVSVVRITTGGKIETIESYTTTSTSTIITSTQSSVGIVMETEKVITMFGQGSFSVQELKNPSQIAYLGVVNLNTNEIGTTTTSTATTSTTTTTTSTTTTTTSVTTTTTENPRPNPEPETADDGRLIYVVDQEIVDGNPSNAIISPEQPFGILISENTSVTIDGVTVSLPPSSVLVVESTQDGGSATSLINGFTSGSSQATLLSGTKISILKLNKDGTVASRKEVGVTQSTTTITLPSKTPIGTVTITNEKLVSIGKWIYSYTYITYLNKISYYQVISSVSTKKVAVLTESTSISTNGEFISGILTVGGSTSIESITTSGFSVQPNQQLGIVPPGGAGVVTIKGQEGESTQIKIEPGTLMTIKMPSGEVTNLYQQIYTSSSSQITMPAGSLVSIVRVTTSGKMQTINSFTVNGTSSIVTSVQSSVGVISEIEEIVTRFGKASFSVQELKNPVQAVYLGVINLNAGNDVESSTTSTATTTTTTTTVSPLPNPAPLPPPEIISILCPKDDPNDFSKFSLQSYPYDCSKFTQCLRQEGQVVQFYAFSCSKGYFFNPLISQCDVKENVQCDSNAAGGSSEGIFGIQCDGDMYRYPTDCQRFYQCVADDSDPNYVTLYLFPCSAGLIFDEDSKRCLKPEETASCEEKVLRIAEFDQGSPIASSAIYRLTQELKGKSGLAMKRITSRSELHPYHAGRGAVENRVMIRMSARGLNGRLHVADFTNEH